MRYLEDDIMEDIPRSGNISSRRKMEDEKYKPIWLRGRTTVDEQKSARLNNKPKLYHSTVDISSFGHAKRRATAANISKSLSMHGLHHMPSVDTVKYVQRNGLSRTNSSLNLPNLEPDIEISGRPSSRESTATTVLISRNGRPITRDLVPDMDDARTETTEDDIYPSDDDPDISRVNLDRAGDYIVEHDWILKETLAKEARKINHMHKQIKIVLPDEDPLDTIKDRMEEISMMVKPKAEFGNFIQTIDPEQRERIMKYKNVDHKEIRNKKRKHWTSIQRFKAAVEMVLVMFRACHPRKRYLSDDKPDTSPDGVKKIKQKSPKELEQLRKSSLGFEMQLSLVAQPEYRTLDEVKKITWLLKAMKAFKHLFPAQLEEQLASVVSYERYDDKRIVTQQGRDPERFYYVLTGKLLKVREYRLMSGIVTRVEGYIEKGHTTDPQEMMQNWPREHHLVTKGYVEVLILEKNDFLDLLHTCKGPPVDFLQGLDLFKEFPCEEFRYSPDAIDFRYYGQEKLIVKDTNRTPWLHVVKTGTVKVVRMQPVIDVQNDDKFSGQATEELGCVRSFSHANAMLGLLASQRKMKTMVGTVSFPEVIKRPAFERSHTEYFDAEKSREATHWDTTFDNPITRRPPPTFTHSHANNQATDSAPQSPKHTSSKKKSKNCKTSNVGFENNKRSPSVNKKLSDITEDAELKQARLDNPTLIITSPRVRSPPSSDRESFLPPIHDNKKGQNGDFVPHGTYLTRERTEFDPVYNKKQKKEQPQRKTYLQLDLLKPGDIFVGRGFMKGLEHMEPQALASEPPGVSLISCGAEIIKISKRFFLAHAQNNTMLKVETMQREYMSTEEAKTILYDKETWNQYKAVLMQRTVGNLSRSQEKVP